MSTRDRELLKAAGLSQTAVAALFGVSPQGINRGVSAHSDYFTPERLGKLIDLLHPTAPEKAAILRERLQHRAERAERTEEKRTFYIQVRTLADLLTTTQGGVIWIVNDPLTRVEEEVDMLYEAVRHHLSGRLVLVLPDQAKVAHEMLEERVLANDWRTPWGGECVVVQSDRLGLAPEMLLSKDAVFLRTTFGFQEARDPDARFLRQQLLLASKLSPDYLPARLGTGYQLYGRYAASPWRRLIAALCQALTSQDPPPLDPVEDLSPLLIWLQDEAPAPGPAVSDPMTYALETLPSAVEAAFDTRSKDLVMTHLLRMKLLAV